MRNGAEELVEGVGEELDPIDHQFVCHLVDRDAGSLERGHLLLGLVDVSSKVSPTFP